MKTQTKQSTHVTPEWSIVTGLKKAGDYCIHSYGELICSMPTDAECFTPSEKARREANARIINAAPDMYEALKTAIGLLEDEGLVTKEMYEAIEKAEGKL